MTTFARTALAADELASRSGQRATFGRLDVAPNGTNAIPSRVTAWLDARCESDAEQVRLVAELERLAGEHAASDGTRLEVTPESVSGEVAFDPALTERLRSGLTDRLGDVPVIATAAGHDAGILAAAGIPTAMLFVRNPTGVSHSSAEHAAPADCLVGVSAHADTLERLLA
jgi:N-carbamoyl-L-amino-acid hydrolase